MVCQNKIAKKALKKQPSHFTTPLNVALYFITYFRSVLLLWFRGSVVFCRFFDRTMVVLLGTHVVCAMDISYRYEASRVSARTLLVLVAPNPGSVEVR